MIARRLSQMQTIHSSFWLTVGPGLTVFIRARCAVRQHLPNYFEQMDFVVEEALFNGEDLSDYLKEQGQWTYLTQQALEQHCRLLRQDCQST